ncbi:hypothetical protein EIP86_006260 [Pleurotus ostreatoroseus]|nr:hypothetical protein EIP86_006260 [Pleurotus ostreatoroseus]
MVKGGKIISTGYNHHRTHYDGGELVTHGNRKPVSMHAEMHAIYNVTGMTPSFKTQVQALERPSACSKRTKPRQPPKVEGPLGHSLIDARRQSLVLCASCSTEERVARRGWDREQKQAQAWMFANSLS